MLALSGNLHAGVRLLKILNHLACRAIQGFSIIGIALGLRHADDQPICKAAMAAPIVQDSSLGSERNAGSVAVGILLPIVRILERVRTRLILGEVARWRRRSSGGARRSERRFFHCRQGQHLALDGFEFSGVSREVWLYAPKLLDFPIHALDAMLRIREVGKQF